ncbi:MAG: universal stress protein [Sediminicola sp.]
MENNILLPTDFSKNSLNAIKYALEMYKDQACGFFFLNAFQVEGYSLDNMMVPEPGERDYEAALRTSERELKKFTDVLSPAFENPLHTYHNISAFGFLLDVVNHYVNKRDIDLVVMGTKGATDSELLLFGSNTVAIMESLTVCPLLSVPQGYAYAPPKEIVFPTDYKILIRKREVLKLIEIAKISNAGIRILHIGESDKLSAKQHENKERLEDIFEAMDHSFHYQTDVKVSKGIALFAEGRGSDMVAFLNKKHSLFSLMLSKPLVQELGYHSKIPLLLLHDIHQ